MSLSTVLTILAALLFWLCLGLAFALLFGRLFRGPGEREREVDKLVDVAHLGERRARREARNGMGRVGKAS